ncbi:MAG: helix-turn-helix domain-containing protein [Methanomassiliicoccales archaeon]|jgi:AcrR family transcriptional regulator
MRRTIKKRAERRNEFIATAEELLNEKGFGNTSVDDVVDRTGVAESLFC